MNNPKLELIHDQAIRTRKLTLGLLEDTPFDLWYTTPEIIESNIAWQVGHLIVSQQYHAIAVIVGPQREVLDKIPLKEYIPLYSMFAESTVNDLQPAPERLLSELAFVDEYAHQVLDGLSDEQLDEPLAKTAMKHPMAKTKYEALTWSFRHEMWHAGQISSLKRVLGHATDWAKVVEKG